ncbi:ABC transporter ATP-binding protein [Phytohalomonas tamaricis]|uniref:ABC transporter ATP-binding protein n=1 Tax=Phytohalomonas tamaricis TaxID=2081032 RepID=UPI000D0BE4DD|nr:sn-glycerol-3-phosphate ABC transporter ATP-binding protein UgpC [Phytohalomonas tamaricis]
MAKLVLDKVNKRFGNAHIIRDVSLEIENGEFVVFVGPSGCGKSTLLRLIAGLESISGGELNIAGRRVNELAPRERGVGMVFQSYALYPHMTVYENIAFGLKLAKADKHSVRERVEQTARILQLETLLDRKPKALSGGQRQRVAMGRAMAREPDILLFDEPLSNLDASLRVQMRNEIARLHDRLGSTVVYVTHDQIEAMTLADKIVVLNGGIVEQVGSPRELYEHPRSRFVAGFIGSPRMNFLPVTLTAPDRHDSVVSSPHLGKLTLPIDTQGLEAGLPLTLGIRPEHIVLDDGAETTHQLPVANMEFLGNEAYVYLEVAGAEELLVCRTEATTPWRSGQSVTARIITASAHLFNADGHALQRQVRDQAAA